LAAYIDIERFALNPQADAAKVKEILDRSETRLGEYISRLSQIDPNAKDPDANERRTFLAARRGSVTVSPQVTSLTSLNVSQYLQQVAPGLSSMKVVAAAETVQSGAESSSPLQPGTSLGDAGGKRAGTLCCFVKAKNEDKRYLVTAAQVVGN